MPLSNPSKGLGTGQTVTQARAPRYNLLSDYGDDTQSITTAPGWVVAVVRLGLPLSFDRSTNKSVTTDVSEGGRLRGPTLIITSDCTNLTVTGGKDTHVKALSATLKQTDHNYLVEILPGDWVLAWMVNYRSDIPELIKKIRENKTCNTVADGFKFVGRVESIRKRASLDRASGFKTSDTTLVASGFKELDTQFFYDPQLRDHDQSLGSFLAKIAVSCSNLFEIGKDGQKNNSSSLIKTMLQVLIGKGANLSGLNGPSKTTPQSEPLRGTTGGNAAGGTGAAAQYAYIIPRSVGKLLGYDDSNSIDFQLNKPGGVLAYSDILHVDIGVQTYENKNAEEIGKRFKPSLKELLGVYIPLAPNFVNTPLWSILQQFLNPYINEMYTALKVDENGLVVPTLVARQIPSTDAFAHKKEGVGASVSTGQHSSILAAGAADGANSGVGTTKDIDYTYHLDLPRWMLSSVMVNSFDIGRSDATRCNFVHVYGKDMVSAGGATSTQQLVTSPPARDDIDIQRSGLRPYIATVACNIKDTFGSTPAIWNALVADRMIGSQYTLNGTITSLGIQAPIAEGDNLEWDGVVYQIESVSHSCGVTSDGQSHFTTTLTLANGYRDRPSPGSGSNPTGGGDDGSPGIYPAFKGADNTGYDPGQSIDDSYDRSEPFVDERDKSGSEKNYVSKNLPTEPGVGEAGVGAFYGMTSGTKRGEGA